MIPTDSNRIHDIFPTLVFSGGTLWQTVRIMFCSKVMSKFMCCNQVSLLFLNMKKTMLEKISLSSKGQKIPAAFRTPAILRYTKMAGNFL